MNPLSSMFPPGPVLTDGAWGTELQRRGLKLGELADLWNLSHPEAVRDVAKRYVEAGSQLILTNTFRANPLTLAAHGFAAQCREINGRGVALSLSAASSDRVRVFASIGPTGERLATGKIDQEDVAEAFRVQADALAQGGADALLFETFSDVEEARLAVRAAKPTGLPILVSFTYDSTGGVLRTFTGATPEEVARAMADEGVDAIGANCGAGPDDFVALCRRLKAASNRPLWIKPNAGLPAIQDGLAVYSMTPERFAAFGPDLIEAGATFLGGCCGTSPEFIRSLAMTVQGSPDPGRREGAP